MNVKPKKKYQPQSLVTENKTVLNLKIISNLFNKFLTQSGSKIDKKIEKSSKNHKTTYKNQMKIVFF